MAVMPKPISDKEFEDIRVLLDTVGSPVFVAMWDSHTRMVLSDDCDIVQLEMVNREFRINANRKYWKTLSQFQKCFFICHEFMHVILGHWVYHEDEEDDWANVAQDIQVNEFLDEHYPLLTVNNVKERKNQAWIDTVFKDKANQVERGKNYTYYYALLVKCLK